MWKNVFVESCVLSLLIFGGLYINASILKKEIFISKENFFHGGQNEVHVSGHLYNAQTSPPQHFSGNPLPTGNRSSFSGVPIPTMPANRPHVSGSA